MAHALLLAPEHEATQPKSGATLAEIVAFLTYSSLLLAATVHHTFWRDEAQAWLIARDSSSIRSLLHNTRYEGHPPAWHLVLYAITRVTWNVEWMKLPNYFSALVAVVLIVRTKATNIAVRLGFVFSYYMLFEYGVIARNYMIGIALLLGAIALIQRRAGYGAAITLLSGAALTSLPALVIAILLILLLLNLTSRTSHSAGVLRYLDLDTSGLAALGLFVLSAFTAAARIRPPADSGVQLHSFRAVADTAKFFESAGALVGRAYLSVPHFERNFWDDRSYSPHTKVLIFFFGWAALVGVGFYLRSRPVRWFYFAATAAILAELQVAQRQAARNIGWLFVVLMCSILLDEQGPVSSTPRRTARSLLPAVAIWTILCSQVAAAAFALAVGLRYSFSSSKQVAEYLRQHQLDQAVLVPKPFYSIAPVLAYLRSPSAYDVDRHKNMSFSVWDREENRDLQIPLDSTQFRQLENHGRSPVLITETPLIPAQITQLDVKLLASFGGTICSEDRFFLYIHREPSTDSIGLSRTCNSHQAPYECPASSKSQSTPGTR